MQGRSYPLSHSADCASAPWKGYQGSTDASQSTLRTSCGRVSSWVIAREPERFGCSLSMWIVLQPGGLNPPNDFGNASLWVSLAPVCVYLDGIFKMGVKYKVVSKQRSETPEEECACFWGDRCPLLPFGLLPLLKVPGMVSWHMQRTLHCILACTRVP